MAKKGFLRFLALFTVALAHMHDPPPCEMNQFFYAPSNSCMPCHMDCEGGTCDGPDSDDCLLVCPIFREVPQTIKLFPAGVRIHDDDHNQIHMMEKAEFWIDDVDQFGDVTYVSLKADVSGTNITMDYNNAEAKLTLMGLAHVTEYNTVLKTITFTNMAPTPPLANRHILFHVFDGDLWSPLYDLTLKTEPVNNHAPEIDATANPDDYVENGPAINIFTSVDITDADHPSLFLMEEAMIWVEGDFSDPCFGHHQISVDLGSYGNEVTLASGNNQPMIHLMGSASIEVYEHIIQTAMFQTVGGEPPYGEIKIGVKINDGKFNGTTYVEIGVSSVDDSLPQIEGIPVSLPIFIPGEDPTTVVKDLELIDCDDNEVHRWTRAEAIVVIRTPDFPDEELEVNLGSIDTIVQANSSTRQHIILIPKPDESEAPVLDFQRTLRTLTYDNKNENISCPIERIIKLTVWDSMNMTEANARIIIEPNNVFPPALRVIGTGSPFEEDSPTPIRLLTSARITDRDMICNTLVMEQAEVNVTAPDGIYEEIGFDLTQSGLTANRHDNGDGTVTILLHPQGGSAVDSHIYERVIRSITYKNTADEPNLDERTVWFRIFDGKFYSTPEEITVRLGSRNDQPPVLQSPFMVYNFTENGPNVLFDQIELTDADSDPNDQTVNIVDVFIENNGDVPTAMENLVFTIVSLPSGITTEVVSTSHVRINGPDSGLSPSIFNNVLQSLQYSNGDDEPIPGRRAIAFQIRSSTIGQGDVTYHLYLDVFGVNDSPTFVVAPAMVNYTERSPPIYLAPQATLSDADLQPTDVNLTSIKVDIQPGEEGATLLAPNSDIHLVSSQQSIEGSCMHLGGCTPQLIVDFVRGIKFAINRTEPPKIADQVVIVIQLEDVDGNVGNTSITVKVQHICDPGTLYLNATAMSSMTSVVFIPNDWIYLVPGPVMIMNIDSMIIKEIELVISKNFDEGNDEFMLTNDAASLVTRVDMLGGQVIRLEGTLDHDQAKIVLMGIRFRNIYECRIVGPRAVEIRLLDDCGAWTNIANVTIYIQPINEPPIVYPQAGSRDPIEHTYVIQGVANTNPPHLEVFPHFSIDDCDGPSQGLLAWVNVTIVTK